MIVMKFGGTSVKNSEAVDRVSGIIATRIDKNPIVVVSATGDTTDRLVDILDLIDCNKKGAIDIVNDIEKKHQILIEEVVTDKDQQSLALGKVNAELSRLKDMVSAMEKLGDVSLRSRDSVLAIGERMSAPILAGSLASRGINAVNVDPVEVIETDENFGMAKPFLNETETRCKNILVPLCKDQKIPVVGGFVGATSKGIVTTLGRGGSDLTASIIAKSVNAEALEFWKDVDGILTADPRLVKDAKLLSTITFAEASELTFLGSGVLHPASIQPAVEAGIPVTVRNSYKPESEGTKILLKRLYESSVPANRAAASIAYKRNQALISIYSTRMIGASGFLRKVFEVFDRLNISVDHIATSEVNITVTVEDQDLVKIIARELGEIATVQVTRNAAIISIVGEALKTTAGVAARVFSALTDINVLFITHSGASTNLSVVVEDEQLNSAVLKLHEQLFNK
ncbi:MAG: aspartate kinase [Deltaproteobacteria bacterium]|nr:aspartate kinase [Deltaproteobacteria bacterium]